MAKELVRKSPIVIVRNFIALEFCAGAVYWITGTLFYVGEIWQRLPVLQAVPFSIGKVLLLFLLETMLIMYMFLLWHRESFRIEGGMLVHDEGVILRRHEVISLDRVVSATYRQGMLGRRTGYGTITLADRDGNVLMKMGSISEPKEFVARITGQTIHAVQAEPLRLLLEAEHEQLEKKSTLRWDLVAGKTSRGLERAAMKTVAAFLNTVGGHLLLGVDDNGRAVGLEHDYKTLTRRDADGWENHFNNVLTAMIGPQFRSYVKITHFKHEGKACAMVAVARAPYPAYLKDENKEDFFIRTGNATSALTVSRVQEYIAAHFA